MKIPTEQKFSRCLRKLKVPHVAVRRSLEYPNQLVQICHMAGHIIMEDKEFDQPRAGYTDLARVKALSMYRDLAALIAAQVKRLEELCEAQA